MITDPAGRLLFCGQTRPGSIHDLTQVRPAGLAELLALTPSVTLLADAGYQGLSAQTAGALLTPRPARRRKQLPVFPAAAVTTTPDWSSPPAERPLIGSPSPGIHVRQKVGHG